MKVVEEILANRNLPLSVWDTPNTESLVPSVTISEARRVVGALARDHAVLLLSPPGVGKSELVYEAAANAGLRCQSLLGTQIAPEDVSGIPRIVGERSVFCPPRVLLPEDGQPFCLFLDELPAASSDVQKALYSLLLERRLGEHRLPEGSWVVAAGNRAEDHALVRTMSSALVNRVVILDVRPDVQEWLAWGRTHAVRAEILAFIACCPEALSRAPEETPRPFSTPRAWTTLSSALDHLEANGILTSAVMRAVAFGLVSACDGATFCAVQLEPATEDPDLYVRYPELMPNEGASRWYLLHAIRTRVAAGRLEATAREVDAFLLSLPIEHRFAVLVGLVDRWAALGASDALTASLEKVSGP